MGMVLGDMQQRSIEIFLILKKRQILTELLFEQKKLLFEDQNKNVTYYDHLAT